MTILAGNRVEEGTSRDSRLRVLMIKLKNDTRDFFF